MTFEEITNKLILRLKEIYDDRNFIIGVMSFALTHDERKMVLEYIEHGEDVTAESISLLSLNLSQKRA